jgi:hypothetical protein
LTVEKQITILTNKWNYYVSMDHHKDRDCHFYIEKHWAYGKPPVYLAYFNSYLDDDWVGLVRSTLDEAEKDLRDRLQWLIKDAIEHLEDILKRNEDDYVGMSVKNAQLALDYLTNKEVEGIIEE